MLRSSHEDDSLQVIYKADGTVPDKYPPTLKALFEMDGWCIQNSLEASTQAQVSEVETSRELRKEYELPDCSNTRERNLNRLLQFLGVRYQMVSCTWSSPGVQFDSARQVREGAATRSVGLA